ncbi:MAG: helix-turn-helix domain-containing protein [Candidatus Symbiodolus clandestinus]
MKSGSTIPDNGFSKRKVADSIGVNHSTVSRELKRNRFCKRYGAQTAHAQQVVLLILIPFKII